MYKKKIEQYIEAHKQEMLDDICTLCSINSERSAYQEGDPFGEGPSRALAQALKMAEEYGFSINNYDNYVGTADLNGGEHQLDILAHLDVVPAGEGWTVTQPFEPIVKDGKLYGRGTADDKGPAVAALYAMRAVKELGIPVTKNVRLILGTDEECGSSDIEHYYKVEKEAPMTFSPDASFPVINIEKGRFPGHVTASFEVSTENARILSIEAGIKINVVPGKAHATITGLTEEEVRPMAEGVTKETGVQFEFQAEEDAIVITAVGEGAHASTPEEGKNALASLLLLLDRLPFASCGQTKLIHSLTECFPWNDTEGKALGVAMQAEGSGALSLAFTMLTMTETRMEAYFDGRFPIGGNDDNLLKPVEAKLASHGMKLESPQLREPHFVDGNSEFVRTLLNAYELYTGNKGECNYTGGGTYVHDLKNGVAFGASMPGVDNRMHGADEFAYVSDLVASAKIFAQVIADLCK